MTAELCRLCTVQLGRTLRGNCLAARHWGMAAAAASSATAATVSLGTEFEDDGRPHSAELRAALSRLPRRERGESLCGYMHRLSATPSNMKTLGAITEGKKIEDLPFSRLCDRLTKCSTDAGLRPGTRFDALVPRDLAYLWFTGQSLFPLFRLILPLQVRSVARWWLL